MLLTHPPLKSPFALLRAAGLSAMVMGSSVKAQETYPALAVGFNESGRVFFATNETPAKAQAAAEKNCENSLRIPYACRVVYVAPAGKPACIAAQFYTVTQPQRGRFAGIHFESAPTADAAREKLAHTCDMKAQWKDSLPCSTREVAVVCNLK